MPAIRKIVNEVEDEAEESQPESKTDLDNPPSAQKQLPDEDDAKCK
jgi:hypothetical protein